MLRAASLKTFNRSHPRAIDAAIRFPEIEIDAEFKPAGKTRTDGQEVGIIRQDGGKTVVADLQGRDEGIGPETAFFTAPEPKITARREPRTRIARKSDLVKPAQQRLPLRAVVARK